MSSEYTKLTNPEIVYGEKNLLQSQLEILNSIKYAHNYQKLRKKELRLRIELKRKLSELRTFIKDLEKGLPKIKEEPKKNLEIKKTVEQQEPKKEVIKDDKMPPKKEMPPKKPKDSLEEEIEDIRNRLRSLQ